MEIFSTENGLQNGPDKTATIKSVKGLVSPFVMFRHSSNCQIKIKWMDKEDSSLTNLSPTPSIQTLD